MRANELLSVYSLAFTVESTVDASEGLGCCHSLFTVESTVEAYEPLSVYSLAAVPPARRRTVIHAPQGPHAPGGGAPEFSKFLDSLENSEIRNSNLDSENRCKKLSSFMGSNQFFIDF